MEETFPLNTLNTNGLASYNLEDPINRNPQHQVRMASGPYGPAVVKTIPLSDDPFLRRILAAEQAGAELQRKLWLRYQGRPIPKVYDTGISDDSWFVAMERVDGTALSECFLLPREAFSLTLELARYLQLWQADGASQAVFVGDIKPSNMMRDREGRLWIVDFGAVQSASNGSAPDVVRSLAYCSPERLESRIVTPASDRWALMVSFYELLVGCRPFDLEMGFTSMPPLVTGLEPAWYALLTKGLELDPTRRHASAEALVADLEAVMNAGAGVPPSERE